MFIANCQLPIANFNHADNSAIDRWQLAI